MQDQFNADFPGLGAFSAMSRASNLEMDIPTHLSKWPKGLGTTLRSQLVAMFGHRSFWRTDKEH